MKKVFSTLLLAFIAMTGYSQQSFVVVGTYPDPVVGNFDVKTHVDLYIKNISTSKPVTVRGFRTKNDLTSGQATSFCLGTNCYSTSANQSSLSGDVIAPGDSLLFTAYYEPTNVEGCGDVEFQIVNKATPTELIAIPFHFKTTNATCTTAIQDEVNGTSVLSLPYPNPTSAAVNFKYELPRVVSNAAVTVFDMQGRQVVSLPLTDAKGEISIDTQSLQSGVYQIVATGEGAILATKRFSVVR